VYVIQEHIIKMYDNIASLKFVKNTSGQLVVTTLVSAEKEEMELLKQVMTDSRVEEWMSVVLHEMRLANRKITKTALFYYCDNMTRLEWMMKYQVGLLEPATNYHCTATSTRLLTSSS